MEITFSNETGELTEKDVEAAKNLGEEFFETESDPGQLQIDKVTYESIAKFPYSLNVIKDDDFVIGYTYVFPCNKDQMERFLSGKMTENELFNASQETITIDNLETIYLCAAYVKPDYRRKGLALEAMVDSIKRMAGNKQITLFAWPWSEEGKQMARKVSEMGFEIRLKPSE